MKLIEPEIGWCNHDPRRSLHACSTEEQATEGFSIEGQRSTLLAYRLIARDEQHLQSGGRYDGVTQVETEEDGRTRRKLAR